jgi:hypothetical protein
MQELRVAGKRRTKDRMGRTCVDGDEEKGRTLQGGNRLAKGGKAFRIWLKQPDALNGNKELEEEEEEEEEEGRRILIIILFVESNYLRKWETCVKFSSTSSSRHGNCVQKSGGTFIHLRFCCIRQLIRFKQILCFVDRAARYMHVMKPT